MFNWAKHLWEIIPDALEQMCPMQGGPAPPGQVGYSTSVACSTTSSPGTPGEDPQIYEFRSTIDHNSPKRISDKGTGKQILNVMIPWFKLACFLSYA